MDTELNFPHLSVDVEGEVRIAGSRYKVIHLAAEHYHHGWTADELLRQHPDLRPEEIYSALAYFYDHRESMIAKMKASCFEVEANRPSQHLSREELLRRKPIPEN